MKRLIVNADDFGLNHAATEGVAECFLAGTVTSATLMVNAPAVDNAAQFALGHPKLGVGLHFNLTWGRPLSLPSEIPALLNAQAEFHNRRTLAKKFFLGQVPLRQVETELRAQMAHFRALGLQPSHIDSHQHVHAFPTVFTSVATCCEREGIPLRVPWVARETGASPSRRLRRLVLKTLLLRATRTWRGKVVWTDGLGSLFDVEDMGMPPGDDHYRRILSGASGSSFELMVHPVVDAGAMTGYTGIGQISEAEWRYLRAGRLSRLASEMGFEMSTYRDLAR